MSFSRVNCSSQKPLIAAAEELPVPAEQVPAKTRPKLRGPFESRGEILTALLSVYLASGLSFLFTILRDYSATRFLSDPRPFFDLIYICSISSGLSINALSVGIATRPHARLVLFLGVLGGGVQIVATQLTGPRSPLFLCIGLCVTALYIYGAYLARLLADDGRYFLSRSREGIANAIICVGLTVGAGLLALPLGIALSLILLFLIVQGRRTLARGPVAALASPLVWRKLVWELIFVNSAPLYMNIWALRTSQLDLTFCGLSALIVVRLIMYVFQFSSLFAFVLRNMRLSRDCTRVAHRLQIIMTLLCAVFLGVPAASGIFLGPLLGFALLGSTIFTLCAENNAFHAKLPGS